MLVGSRFWRERVPDHDQNSIKGALDYPLVKEKTANLCHNFMNSKHYNQNKLNYCRDLLQWICVDNNCC